MQSKTAQIGKKIRSLTSLEKSCKPNLMIILNFYVKININFYFQSSLGSHFWGTTKKCKKNYIYFIAKKTVLKYSAEKQSISIRNTVTTHPTPTPPPKFLSPNSYCLPVEYCHAVDYCLPIKYCMSVDYFRLYLVYHLWDSLKINIIFLNYNSYGIMIRKTNVFNSCISRKFSHQRIFFM